VTETLRHPVEQLSNDLGNGQISESVAVQKGQNRIALRVAELTRYVPGLARLRTTWSVEPATQRRAARAERETHRAFWQRLAQLSGRLDQSFSSISGLWSSIPMSPAAFFEYPVSVRRVAGVDSVCGYRARVRRCVVATLGLHSCATHVCATRSRRDLHDRAAHAMPQGATSKCLRAAREHQGFPARMHLLH